MSIDGGGGGFGGGGGSSSGAFLVGAIVAKLQLDKSGWTAGVKSTIADGQRMMGMSAGLAAGLTRMGTGITVMGAAVTGVMMKFVNAAGEQAKAERRVEQVLRSTHEAAGLTKKDLVDLAEGFQRTTTFGDELVLEAEAMLLTFTKIGKDVFPGATEAVLNLAEFMNGDLQSAAIRVGKALQDPILGVTALRRVGVNFDKTMADNIKTLVEHGRVLDAQKIILRELATEFGGQASVATQGFGGSVKQLKNELHDVQKEIGFAVIPMMKSLVGSIRSTVSHLQKWMEAHPDLTAKIAKTVATAGLLMLAVGPFLVMIPKVVGAIGVLASAFSAMGGTLAFLAGAFALVEIARKKFFAGVSDEVDEQTKKWNTLIYKIGGGWSTMAEQALASQRKILGSNKLTAAQLQDIWNKYGGNTRKTLEAIFRGDEGKDIKAVFEKLYGDQKKFIDGQKDGAAASYDLKGAIAALPPDIRALIEGFNASDEAADKFKETTKDLGDSLKTDLRQKIQDLSLTLIANRKNMTESGIVEMKKEIAELSAKLSPVFSGAAGEAAQELSEFEKFAARITAPLDEDQKILDDVNDELERIKDNQPKVAKAGEKAAKEMSNAWEEALVDMSRNIAKTFVEILGISSKLLGTSTKHNEKYFKKALDDIDKEYKARLKLLELQEPNTEQLSRDYELKKHLIEEELISEEEKDKKLKALDDWYFHEKEKAYDADKALQEEKRKLEEWYEAEKARIEADAEKSREDHAASELARQNSLWTKVKGIFGNAIEQMMETWIARLLQPILTDILVSIIPSLGKIGTETASSFAKAATASTSSVSTIGGALGSLGTGVATIITSIVGAVATGITTIASAIATAVVALATGIASAATILAAAAPALLTVGAIALGLYAGFKLLGSLLGGNKGNNDITYWLKLIHDLTREAHDWIGQLWSFVLSEQWTALQRLRDVADAALDDGRTGNGLLAAIVANTARTVDAILGVPGAAAGAIVGAPSLVRVGEFAPRVPEVIVPLPDLPAYARAMSPEGGAGARIRLALDGQDVPIDLDGIASDLLIRLVPELSKRGLLSIHPIAVRRA